MAKKRKGNGNLLSQIRFHYLKSGQFRTIHADGAIGSITPQGLIHMALYNERPAIPREMVQEINDDGTLGSIIHSETISREGVVREMDTDVVMNINCAKSLKKWLSDKIEEFEKQQPNIKSKKRKK